MRIDSGLSNFFYNNRFQHTDTEVEDTSAATTTASRPRTASNPSVSSTLLSSSLASALWTVEGAKRGGANQAEELARASSAEKVEAFYLEYAMPVDDVH
ncbi:hypothetical protein [Rhizobium sp. RU36D]|uniref:hypothetical protein n=1 Tax=Rhizobium sp. RU36D TaxID=1907415 RepID=UPI0009D8E513|nr:hypothetical protein [Rhizobium sp. RU36D]SMD19184.1 hypothetical protein SAMN05880593_13932 [Rhizobium sp. RU36D]